MRSDVSGKRQAARVRNVALPRRQRELEFAQQLARRGLDLEVCRASRSSSSPRPSRSRPSRLASASASAPTWHNLTSTSLVQHHQTRMTPSFPTVPSAPPTESEKCPFNNVNGSHTSHSTQSHSVYATGRLFGHRRLTTLSGSIRRAHALPVMKAAKHFTGKRS